MTRIRDLIAAVGRKRFVILVTLVMLDLALMAGWQKWFLPQFSQVEMEKSGAEADRSRLQADIIALPSKYEALHKDEARYDVLAMNGFMQPQDRIVARQKMDALRDEAGLRGIGYNIKPQEKVAENKALPSTEEVVKSEIEMDFKALTDLEIREFIERMRAEFSGLVVTKSIQMERREPLNEGNLLLLSRKTPVDFIIGKASFDWFSLAPQKAGPDATTSQAFGGVVQ